MTAGGKNSLVIRSKEECKWDLVSLGEVMLRLDPGHLRVATARQFQVWEGGGEYNVARGLRRCFGLKTAVVTALADNPVGRLIEDLMLQGGVDQSHVRWVKYDGVGRSVRNGLNFTERGFGVRAALGCSDRGHTAVSQLQPGQIDWDEIFGKEGSRWLHTGGIFCALSESTPEVCKEAMIAARKHGTIVSYDLNYRDSLWKSIGGKARATEVNRELASYVDVMIGNEGHFTSALGCSIEGAGEGEQISEPNPASFRRMIEKAVATFPNFRAVATTLRHGKSANLNDWGAVCYYEGKFQEAKPMPNLEIFDRVGGGDSFASGLIYGLLNEKGADWAVNCGCAHGALAMTTPGDATMATFDEVQRIMDDGGTGAQR
jgi:2-dehydro-3-deoxygluconokinase